MTETITPVTAEELLKWAQLCHGRYDLAPAVGKAFERAAASLQAYERERAEAVPAVDLLAAAKRLLTDLRVLRREPGHMSYELGHLTFAALEQIWLAVEQAERGEL